MQRTEPRLAVLRGLRRDDVDDATLATEAAAGDSAAAGAVWDRYSGLVRGVLRRSLGDRDVDDHVQEVFLRFFNCVAELRDPAALRCFLIGIAMRVAGTELRRRRVRRWLSFGPTEDLPERATAPLDATAREALLRLYAILDKCDPDTRLLFTARYVERLELTEVATVFGVSLATVKRRLARVSDRVFGMARRDAALVSYLENAGNLEGTS